MPRGAIELVINLDCVAASDLEEHAESHAERKADAGAHRNVLRGDANSRADSQTESDRRRNPFVLLVAHYKVLFNRCFRMARILLSTFC